MWEQTQKVFVLEGKRGREVTSGARAIDGAAGSPAESHVLQLTSSAEGRTGSVSGESPREADSARVGQKLCEWLDKPHGRMRMRCMVIVMLLGFTAVETYGQRKPIPNVNSQTIISGDSEWTRLKERATDQPAPTSDTGASVSVEELKVPDKAIKEVRLSDKALLAGNLRESTEHLERAVAIDPAVAAWHNGLGARYSGLKKYD